METVAMVTVVLETVAARLQGGVMTLLSKRNGGFTSAGHVIPADCNRLHKKHL